MNPLVPKPGTAYQWLPMEDDASIERKIKRMRSLMAGIDNVYFNIKSERHSFYQALLSLGDRRVAPAIEAAERNGGNWRAAVAEAGVDADFFVFRDRSPDAVLPWDIIDGGMKDALLPQRVREGATARSGRCRRSGRRRMRGSSRSSSRTLPRTAALPAALMQSSASATAYEATAACLLVLRVRLQNQLAERVPATVASPAVGRSSAKLRRSPLTVYWPRGKRDVAAVAGPPLPDGEADQLQAVEDAFGEMQFRVGKLSRRVVLVVRSDFDDHGFLHMACWRACAEGQSRQRRDRTVRGRCRCK